MDVSTLAVIGAPIAVVAGVAAWYAWRGVCHYLSDLDDLV